MTDKQVTITHVSENGLFEIDGETLAPGESTRVTEERAKELLERYPEQLSKGETVETTGASTHAQAPAATAAPETRPTGDA